MTDFVIYLLLAMIGALMVWPTRMPTITAVTALLTLAISGSHAPEIVRHIGASYATVLVVMSATQLGAKKLLQGGAGERISIALARLAAHRWLRRVPAPILIPAIFVPAAMLLAALAHNITSIAVLTPLALAVCSRYGVGPGFTLNAMLISSNLGGASMAAGDTPAILQRLQWGFSPAQFAAAMLPRNLIILALLTAVACLGSWLPMRFEKTDWRATLKRLKVRDQVARDARYRMGTESSQALVGAAVLVSFIGLQFVFPQQTLVLACAAFAGLVLITPDRNRLDALVVLGVEPVIVIGSLFVVAGAVEQAAAVRYLTNTLAGHAAPGAIEIVAYVVTAGISADGAAAMLAPLVHQLSGGAMLSAWQLAGGICAGSSVFLTSASAGPILYAISRISGYELTFRAYAKFGALFSALMLMVYIALNRVLP